MTEVTKKKKKKKNTGFWYWYYDSIAKWLPSMCEALSLIANTKGKKRRKADFGADSSGFKS
jgi:hypothetical protein